MDPLVISAISAATALVASMLGPIVSLKVARRQFNATVLSTNRQKWIETLRDTVAELLSLLVSSLVIKSSWQSKWDKGRGPLREDAALLDKLERIVLAESKIRLLLNPTRADHKELSRRIDTAIKRLKDEESLDSDTEADIETITTVAQTILKREWQRVKLGT
ncbi:MAG TPA: hypothetical protein VMB77_13725 [Syntrophales bacterium]|nr:hypothetical protein [Syntrophales bacterium]